MPMNELPQMNRDETVHSRPRAETQATSNEYVLHKPNMQENIVYIRND